MRSPSLDGSAADCRDVDDVFLDHASPKQDLAGSSPWLWGATPVRNLPSRISLSGSGSG
jgi:hypothetical protein